MHVLPFCPQGAFSVLMLIPALIEESETQAPLDTCEVAKCNR